MSTNLKKASSSENLTLVKREELEAFSARLLETLDEHFFFNEMSRFFLSAMNADRVKIFSIRDDQSAKLVSVNGETSRERIHLGAGEGASGYVTRTKRPYFSNNVARDPLFSTEQGSNVVAELCLPILHEGMVMATIHFQMLSDKKQYSLADITLVTEVLKSLRKPITNMKMYLSAKHLNEVLIKKIEDKEKELQEQKNGTDFISSFKITEQEIIAESESTRALIELADKIAYSDINVLVQGGPGTGKEHITRRIHCRSQRKNMPFVAVDCSSLSDFQLETEIFGEERWDQDKLIVKKGQIELANGGTLLLNDIDSIGLPVQARLLKFFQEKLIQRVNSKSQVKLDVRVMVTTSKNIADEVESGKFRDDLYYTLNTISLNVLPLKDRVKDIEKLALYYLNYGRSPEEQKFFSKTALEALIDYSWPGNVRELQNVVERAYILSENRIVEKDLIEESLGIDDSKDSMFGAELLESENFQELTLSDLERQHILRTLDYLGGNKTKTARTLGITVKTLYNKLNNYQIESIEQ